MAKRPVIEAVLHPLATLQNVFGLMRMAGERRPRPTAIDRRTKSRQTYDNMGLFKRRFEPGYQVTRLQLYCAYDEMDYDPIIASVLDAFADEATQRNPDNGKIIWIESANEEIQKILTNQLESIEQDAASFGIVRGIAKFGDHFEGIPATRGDGIRRLVPYYPYDVARQEGTEGELLSFTPSDEQGRPSPDSGEQVPYYALIHWRLHGRNRMNPYGDSLLANSLEYWRDLQMVEDQLLIQRLMRQPERLLVLLDTAGMGLEESYEVCKEWEQNLHRQWAFDRDGQRFVSGGGIFAESKDVVLPLGEGNATRIEKMPATQQNDQLHDLDYWLNRLLGGLHVPKAYFGLGSDNYDSSKSLGKQDIRFAKTAARLQFSYLTGVHRLCAIHLAFLGLNPLEDKNQFRVQMTPVSYFMELERAELLNMRADLVERHLRLGETAGMNMSRWTPYVLSELGKMSLDLIERLLGKESEVQANAAEQSQGSVTAVSTPSADVVEVTTKSGSKYKLARSVFLDEIKQLRAGRREHLMTTDYRQYIPREFATVIAKKTNLEIKGHLLENITADKDKASVPFAKDGKQFETARKAYRQIQLESAKTRLESLRQMAHAVEGNGNDEPKEK